MNSTEGLANRARNAVKFNHIWDSVYQNKFVNNIWEDMTNEKDENAFICRYCCRCRRWRDGSNSNPCDF
jgi:hypothetical protein